LRKACNQKFLKEIIEILFICLDTKAPKNQGKKNAARSAASAFYRITIIEKLTPIKQKLYLR